MKIDFSHNLKPKIDLDQILSENFLENRLVRFVHEFAKSVIEIKNEV